VCRAGAFLSAASAAVPIPLSQSCLCIPVPETRALIAHYERKALGAAAGESGGSEARVAPDKCKDESLTRTGAMRGRW
jgi:hypothetical protein